MLHVTICQEGDICKSQLSRQQGSNSIITNKDIEAVFAEPDIAVLLNGSSTQIGFKI